MNDRTLAVTSAVYCGASLLHFAHNAVFVADYPNLPSFITVVSIWWTWIAITSIGMLAWLALRAERRVAGLLSLAVYAAFGFDGLAHYALASMAAHSLAMNGTILFEVATAAALLVAVAQALVRQQRGTAMR